MSSLVCDNGAVGREHRYYAGRVDQPDVMASLTSKNAAARFNAQRECEASKRAWGGYDSQSRVCHSHCFISMIQPTIESLMIVLREKHETFQVRAIDIL